MATSYHLTSAPDSFTISRDDGASVQVGRARGAAHFTPLELFVASLVSCTGATVAKMLDQQHQLGGVTPDLRYRYSQAIGGGHEVQRIIVEVAGIPGRAEIEVDDLVAMAEDAEATRCTVSLTIKRQPTVHFTPARDVR